MPPPNKRAVGDDRKFLELLAEVRRIPLRQTRFVTDVLAGGYRSTFRGVGVEFEEVREYSEGDDPRYVDWNVTARVGRPFVKRFVEEREHTLLFALDGSPSMRASTGAWTPAQAGARFCALVAFLAIANNDRVGLLAGSAGAELFVPPRKGARHALNVVRQSLGFGCGAAPGVDGLLQACSRRLRRRAVVFVLSDFLHAAPGRVLEACSRRHDLVAVRLVSPDLHDPPCAMLRVVDPETGRRRVVDLADPGVRRQWRERAELLRGRLAERCARARADVLEIPIPRAPDIEALAEPVQRFFRRRERREIYR